MLETEPIELVGTLNVGVVARGTNNYDDLINKPVINDIQLDGNLSSADLGLQPAGSYVENETDPVFSASPSAGITSQDITNWNNKSDFSGDYDDLSNKPELFSGDYNDLSNKPDLSQFITKSVNDLTNYYLKSETYTKNEVNSLIGAIQQFHYEIVQELPQTGATNVIYLVPKSTSQTNNVYDEYVYANNNWEKIGDTQIDLSDYVTTSDLNTALADYTTTTDLTTLLSGKQDTLVSGTNIKTINNTSILGTGNISISSASTIVITSFDTTTLTTAFQTWFDNYVNNNLITGIIYTAKSYSGNPDLSTTYIWNGSFAIDSASVGRATYHCDFISTDWSYNLSQSWLKILTCSVSYNWETNLVTSVTIRVNTGKSNYFIPIPYDKKSTSVYRSGGLVLTTDNTTSYTPSNNYNPATKKYVDDKVANYLALNNTTAFTPTGDYNPATKKYVDDNASSTKFYSIKKSDTSATLTNNFTQWLDDYKNGIDDIIVIYDNYGYSICNLTFEYSNGNGTIKLSTGFLPTDVEYNGYGLQTQNINSLSVIATVTNDVITVGNWYSNTGGFIIKRGASYALGINNTTAYTPTNDYNPATKKYVDDAVASAGGNRDYIELPDTFLDILSDQMTIEELIEAFGSEEDFREFLQGMASKKPLFMGSLSTEGATAVRMAPIYYEYYEQNSSYNIVIDTKPCGDGAVGVINFEFEDTGEGFDNFACTIDDNFNVTSASFVSDFTTIISGFDWNKTQVLKNVNGTLTWVDET